MNIYKKIKSGTSETDTPLSTKDHTFQLWMHYMLISLNCQ